MKRTLIRNARVINEGSITETDVLLHKGRIEKIAGNITPKGYAFEMDANGCYLIPGIIDDQVHFREPGLTHKGNIYTESKAAIAGGVTSFMEMPNTVPAATTNDLVEQKFRIASRTSLANYSFYIGTSNNNLEELKKVNLKAIAGIKIFMGSSTGNLVVDDAQALENIFRHAPTLVATHCETDAIVKQNAETFRQQYGSAIPMHLHPEIRSVENCVTSTKLAIDLAKKHGTRLHVLHISTADEVDFFEPGDIATKQITAEACVHHLWFTSDDYERLGGLIKCNPAIKAKEHRDRVRQGLNEGRIDIIATDHAPHTWDEKQSQTPEGKPDYFAVPSGLPLVQHSFNMMYELHREGLYSLEFIVDNMCHKPAQCFSVKERGFIREGYYADLFLFDPHLKWKVEKENLQYKCRWSPLEGQTFNGKVRDVFVNGNHVFSNGAFDESVNGLRLLFERG